MRRKRGALILKTRRKKLSAPIVDYKVHDGKENIASTRAIVNELNNSVLN